jgi:FtsH Extracellular.
MNLKNLAMWAIIVLLTVGLYNMFKNPQGSFTQKNNIIFSEFLSEVKNGRVIQVEIQSNNVNWCILLPNKNLLPMYPTNPI